jgi:hypothetical protein
MKRENKAHLCPLCGGGKNPGTSTLRVGGRDGRSVLRKPSATVADSVMAESSDDKTANDFAALLLLKDRKKRF